MHNFGVTEDYYYVKLLHDRGAHFRPTISTVSFSHTKRISSPPRPSRRRIAPDFLALHSRWSGQRSLPINVSYLGESVRHTNPRVHPNTTLKTYLSVDQASPLKEEYCGRRDSGTLETYGGL